MKKQYSNPMIDIHQIANISLLAGSVTGSGDIDTTDPIGGDAGEAASRELLDEDNDFTNFLWTVVFLLFSITASAQYTTVQPADIPADGKTHGMIIYLNDVNNTQIHYELQDLERVTYLPYVGMKIYLKGETNSIDYLFSQMIKIDYAQDGNTNANWETFGWTDYPEAWRLEYPHLNNNVSPDANADKSQIIVKRTDDFGITYSLEWDNALVANRWTCYELHAGNSMAAVGRNDDFKADPEVAVSSTLDQYSGSGFSRGHLCPSADRLCSKVQNKQTFFLTNMQPQYQSHNGGLWSRLETLVRDYATNDEFTALHCDTLYIVKAATIANVASDPLTGNSTSGVYATSEVDNYNKLIVPRYFYMALLHYNKETDTYHAIAFWTKHLSTTQPVANLADYAISIDKLEQLTGLDFFCNLPDVIEDAVEAQEPNLDFWKKISKSGSE